MSVSQLVDETSTFTPSATLRNNLTQTCQPLRLCSGQAYGETLTRASGASPSCFTGEYTDSSGLIHLRARYYAPGFARFLTKDPWNGDPMQPMSYNPWLYVYSNPINHTDPSGMCFDVDGDGLCDAGTLPNTPSPKPTYKLPLPYCLPIVVKAGRPCIPVPCWGGPGAGWVPGNGGDPPGKPKPGFPSYPPGLPASAQNEYDTFIVLRNTPGWWNPIIRKTLSVYDFLEFFLSMEFALPAKYAKEELQLETAVRNFFEYCVGCNHLTETGILTHIDNKQMLDYRPTLDLSMDKGNIVNWESRSLNVLSTADFSEAFISPNPDWMTGRGNGDVPFDWGNACLLRRVRPEFLNVKEGTGKAQVIWRSYGTKDVPDLNFFYIVSSNQKNFWGPTDPQECQ